MRRPRLNVLRTFEAAGRRLSFSLAAAELNISQAAVSQQMRHLESYLGDALFVRHHRRISLTSSGRIYQEAVHEALERLDNVTDQLFADRPHQVVVLRCTLSLATLWLAPRIQAFKAANPEIELQIKTLEQDGATGVSQGADLEIYISANKEQGAGIKPLLTSTISPVASPEYLEKNRVASPCDLLDLDLIHIVGYDDGWQRWFQTFATDTKEIPRGLTVDSSLFAIDAALRGQGVFLGRRPFLDSYLKSGELVEVFDQPHYLHAKYYLRQQEGAKNTRSKTCVAAWLVNLATSDTSLN